MNRCYFAVWLLIAGASLLGSLFSCDSALENQSRVITVSATTPVMSEATPGEEYEEGDMGDTRVKLEWVDVVGKEETFGLENLVLKASNPNPFLVTVTADVECSGFINRTGKRPLVPHVQRIPPGEEVYFEITANRLPIQSIEGASQLGARVTVKTEPTVSDREWVVRTAPFYFRHDESYRTIRAFNDTALLNRYGGVLSGSKDTPRRPGTRVVGRFLGKDNKYGDIRESDVAVTTFDKTGRAQGTIRAAWMETREMPDGATVDFIYTPGEEDEPVEEEE